MPTRWNLALLSVDYLRLRRQQLGREPGEAEVRGIHGFVEWLIALEQASKPDSPRGPEA